MYKLLLSIFNYKKSINILIYHQVLPDFDPMRPNEVTRVIFDQHLQYLTQNFTVLRLDDAIKSLKEGTLPANAAVITFDDGYENNASVALPLLKKYNVPATIFMASDFLNGGMMWNDRVIEWLRGYDDDVLSISWLGLENLPTKSWQDKRESLGKLLLKLKYLSIEERLNAVEKLTQGYVPAKDFMMTDEQVKLMSDSGVEIGGHTCSHPILAVLDDEETRHQLASNKQYLETILGKEITSFAYPNGMPGKDYLPATKQLVKEVGYSIAVSTSWGVTDSSTDLYQIPRFTPWRNDKFGFLMLLTRNFFNKASFV